MFNDDSILSLCLYAGPIRVVRKSWLQQQTKPLQPVTLWLALGTRLSIYGVYAQLKKKKYCILVLRRRRCTSAETAGTTEAVSYRGTW